MPYAPAMYMQPIHDPTARYSDRSFVAIPVFNVVMDINDLGLFGGGALMILMLELTVYSSLDYVCCPKLFAI